MQWSSRNTYGVKFAEDRNTLNMSSKGEETAGMVLVDITHWDGAPRKLCLCICACLMEEGECMRAKSLSHVLLFAILWTVACRVPLSLGFLRHKYWSGLPFPPPGHLPNPGIEPMYLMSSPLAGRSFTPVPSGKPKEEGNMFLIRVCLIKSPPKTLKRNFNIAVWYKICSSEGVPQLGIQSFSHLCTTYILRHNHEWDCLWREYKVRKEKWAKGQKLQYSHIWELE